MILKNIMIAIGLGGLLFMVTGCAQSHDSAFSQNWGNAFETAKYEQTLDINAGKDTGAVEGMDGQAAQKGYTAYRNGFTESSTSTVSGGELSISGVGD